MHEFASVESTDSSEPAKKAAELLSDEDFFDKEEDPDTDKDKKKQPPEKKAKKTTATKTTKKPKPVAEATSSSSASSTDSSDSSDSSDSDESSEAQMPTPKKKAEAETASGSKQSQHRPFQTAAPSKKSPIVAAQQQTKRPTSFEQYKKQLLKNKLDAISSVKKSVATSLGSADKPKNGASSSSSNNKSSTATAAAPGVAPTHPKPNPQSSFQLFKAKVKRAEEASDSSSSASKATTTPASGAPFNPFKALNKPADASSGAKKVVRVDERRAESASKEGKKVKASQGEASGNDTDLLDSDGNEAQEGNKKKKKKKNQEKSGSPKEGINMKKAAPNQENASADATIQLSK